ncbi:olfactory receptor 8D4 [Orycteropus afer afer]|uniref:Olfactory receptor 8D4 n=1 Tax=Orycteropus afer afer TaxID=1230840 RepID=A0A8B7AKX9_ORYAF|nr:olfactory receptor 8D4 [Orycteropus afer afer]
MVEGKGNCNNNQKGQLDTLFTAHEFPFFIPVDGRREDAKDVFCGKTCSRNSCSLEKSELWGTGDKLKFFLTNLTLFLSSLQISERKVGMKNHSTVTKFLLLGLTDQSELQLPLFCLFLGIYMVTMVGNLGMISIIGLNSKLHTPMYYLLSSLSFLDVCYSSVITPKMLAGFLYKDKAISYSGCMAQLFFFCIFVISECYMLAAMAYDSYVAICKPLLYNAIMSSLVCCLLVAGVFSVGLIDAVIHVGCILRLSFCDSNIISHYFCDIVPLIKLSCSSTYIDELLIFVIGGFNMVATSLMIIISYAFILSGIFHIHSKEGRSKAFSTCSSHLTAVLLFYGSLMSMYLKPATDSSLTQEKASSVFYTTVIPMLNPLIYSLRNKEVKNVLIKLLKRKVSHNECAPY